MGVPISWLVMAGSSTGVRRLVSSWFRSLVSCILRSVVVIPSWLIVWYLFSLTFSLLQDRIDVTKYEVPVCILGKRFFMPCELSSTAHMLMQLWRPAWQPGMPELVGIY